MAALTKKTQAASSAAASAATASTVTEDSVPHWGGWKSVFLCGTEWDNFDLVYKTPWLWNFDHLHADLTNGLAGEKQLHLWGTTEPQLLVVGLKENGEPQTKVVPIPVIVVVVGEGEVPAMLGIKSVQMVEEQIVPMRSQGMEFAPFRELLPSKVDWERQHAFVLSCKTRRARAKVMKEEDARRYEYCLPYIFLPRLNQVSGSEYDSNVSVLLPLVHNGLQIQAAFDYDWRMDGDVADHIDSQIADNGWPTEIRQQLIDHVTQRVAEAKDAIRKQRAELKAKLDAISPEDTVKLNALRFLKYYPQNAFPAIGDCKAPYINRYYGKAHEVK
eukprot:a677991_146.p1 GENE.a677991_146~~a677991_146.p1  ORF type:complete len:339 (-),score=138.49 a677991_146:5-994(-)